MREVIYIRTTDPSDGDTLVERLEECRRANSESPQTLEALERLASGASIEERVGGGAAPVFVLRVECRRTQALEDSIAADRARDQRVPGQSPGIHPPPSGGVRATGPSPEEERRARGLDEEQGIYRARD